MPKTCRVCSRSEPQVHFAPKRLTCFPCRTKQRNSPRTPQPLLDPLAVAYKTREARDASRDSRRQVDALIDENKGLRRQIGELVRLQAPLPALVYAKAKVDRADAVAVAVASDWHVEEAVDKEAVHGLNEYNLDIAKARSERFFQNALRLTDIMARDSKITTLYLPVLGDLFSGYIHEELKASTALAPGDAARFVKGLLTSGIDFLLRESSYKIESDLIPGNHGRMTDKIWFSDPTGTSLETFMYHALAGKYEDNPRVKLQVSDHAMRYRKFFERFTMRLIHGYEVKYGGGIGGITIPIRKALAQWDNPIRADLTVMGHFHQFLDGGNFLVNGSLIGYGTYSQAIKATFEEPKQAFFLIHARNGGQKSVVAPIWLDAGK